MSEVKLVRGDATEHWSLPGNSLDSIVTDPPYGIAFMGKEWDDKGGPQAYQEWTVKWASEAFRCLKPGGFLLAFGSPRMAHRMACGFEDAGFRIVDTIEWLYLTGFPKAQDIGKMFDKRAGAERPIIGQRKADDIRGGNLMHRAVSGDKKSHVIAITTPATPLAKKWDGWKTPSLKPAHEPIIMAQKPFHGTYIDNIEKWGVGAVNARGCRIPRSADDRWDYGLDGDEGSPVKNAYRQRRRVAYVPDAGGRFPANVVTLDTDQWYSPYFNITPRELSKKASAAERRGDGWQNNHPTVKPVELVRWLQRLVTPPGGTTASPFLGSGTDAVAAILEGFNFWGMEIAEEYWPIIEARVAWAREQVKKGASRTAVQQARLSL